ncbi:MAG: hypothetical protein GX889_03455, partial [Clostridiales bacterium]|nr:hypothetical protein [Clostridiales bacterium]
MKKLKKIIVVMLSFILLNAFVVTPKAAVKEDMKAVWISTVYNQDWPSV